ncbi:MAG: hypothetical protein C4309_03920 [Chloroflexota bacterium]
MLSNLRQQGIKAKRGPQGEEDVRGQIEMKVLDVLVQVGGDRQPGPDEGDITQIDQAQENQGLMVVPP